MFHPHHVASWPVLPNHKDSFAISGHTNTQFSALFPHYLSKMTCRRTHSGVVRSKYDAICNLQKKRHLPMLYNVHYTLYLCCVATGYKSLSVEPGDMKLQTDPRHLSLRMDMKCHPIMWYGFRCGSVLFRVVSLHCANFLCMVLHMQCNWVAKADITVGLRN